MNYYNAHYGIDHANSPSGKDTPDQRTEYEKLREAAEEVIAASKREQELVDRSVTTVCVAEYNAAEDRLMKARDEFRCQLEEMTCLAATRIEEALNA